jgi:assimilatory nitrate reductase catalytic subunit
MRLTTGRTVAHYLSGNQTRRIAALVEQTPRPWVEVHPSLGFEHGQAVRVVTRRGSVTYPALVTDTIRPDTVFVPYHWAAPASANALTIDALDPISKIPEYKVCACRVEPGTSIDPVPPPPPPPGRRIPLDLTPVANDDRPPTMPQGRGSGDR